MLELEQTFKAFTELINKNYEHAIEGYPCFPKFSMWRLMTKIWIREVFEKSDLDRSLCDSFLRILTNYRERNVKESLNGTLSKLPVEVDSNEELPKCLYIGLKTKNK